MKKMILVNLLLFVLLVETSCGGASPNAASGGAVSEASGGAVSEVSGGAISDDKEEEDSEREQVERESWDITFEDVLGNRQKLVTGEIDKSDVGTKLSDAFVAGGCFVEGNHFYYMTDGIFRDKGEDLGDITWDSEYDLENWGKYENKLYLVLQKEYELYNDKRPIKFITIDLNTWKTKTFDCSELYDGASIDIYVYNEKLYIYTYGSDNLDEIDMNGKKIRTISLGNDEGKIHMHLQGIVDGKIYYLTWKGHQYVMKNKDLETGEEKKVLQYEQPAYDKKKVEYERSYLHISGNNLFIMDEFYMRNENAKYWYEELGEVRYTLYQLPIKDGGKMKSVYKQKIVDCVFQDDEIYYIDDNHLLHRNNLKKGTDKIISERKVERVFCTKDGLYVIKYKEREAYDEDAVEETVVFYMDFDGQHEKKLFEV